MRPGRLRVNVHEALTAIATTGKGRCWYCDARLPEAEMAIDDGWDVQRIDEHPVASIILVCPACSRQQAAIQTGRVQVRESESAGAQLRGGNGRVQPALSLAPKRA